MPNWKDMIKDFRVISRLQQEHLDFNGYTEDEFYDILKMRAMKGLKSSAYTPDTLRNVAKETALHSGDMRVAIHLMHAAGKIARDTGKTTITHECLTEAAQRTHSTKPLIDFISRLPTVKRLIMLVIFRHIKQNNGKLPTTKDILARYNELIKGSQVFTPIQKQTLSVYLSELCTYGLLNRSDIKGRGRGKGRDPTTYDLDIDKDLFEKEIYTPTWDLLQLQP